MNDKIEINEPQITISVKEYEKLKELSTCGCGLCLLHNSMKCPKLNDQEFVKKYMLNIRGEII